MTYSIASRSLPLAERRKGLPWRAICAALAAWHYISNAAALVKLAKLRHRLLNDAPPDAHAPRHVFLISLLAAPPNARLNKIQTETLPWGRNSN
jgi:hypothetical protein